MSDTPETDDHHQYYKIGVYTLDFCRTLERERDEARNAFIMAVDEMVKAQSQLREAKIEWDRLAEALRMITTFDYTDLQCDNGHGARSVATEALQSLTQTKQ